MNSPSLIAELSPFPPLHYSAILAKTVELTFVMAFLGFLGQVLSRRAQRQQGVNLANLAMRSWILQVAQHPRGCDG